MPGASYTPRLFASMMRFSIWSRHAEAVAPADGVRFEHQRDFVAERLSVERHGTAVLESHAYRLGLDRHVVAPERDAHDRLHDAHALVEELEVLRLVGRAEQIRVGGVRLLRAHLVAEARLVEVLRHLLAAAQLVDERGVEPRLVDAKLGIGEQAVAVEALDVVALVRAAVAPYVDVVLAHRDDEHRARHGAPDRSRVEVREARGRDVECARLQRGDAFRDQRGAAVDEACRLGAVLQAPCAGSRRSRSRRAGPGSRCRRTESRLSPASSAAPRSCRGRPRTRGRPCGPREWIAGCATWK